MTDETLTMLADAAASFASPDAARVRAVRGSADGFDRAVWAQMAELGWYSIVVPETADGLGLDLAAGATIASKLGYAAFPEPFVSAGLMVPWCLSRAGARAAPLLESVTSGAVVAALAWQPERGGLDTAHPGAVATASGTQTVVSGACRFAVPASADAFIVAAAAGDGVGLYWVPRGQAGVSVTAEPCADGTASAWLVLDGVQVAPEHCVAAPADGAALLRSTVDLGTIACSAELVGGMDRALELTLDYLRTRKQFGKPIGSFQALQHRAVDLWIHRQVTRAVVETAIRTFDSPASDARARTLAASSAKARAAQTALLLSNQTIQLHGAIGTTDEYDLGLYVNRALTLSAWMGNASEHRRRFGALSATSAKASA
jgi:alkylation response protein AidB-like acyl-CoA dehydrogenase